jgi:DNA replication protein DnaC
MVLKSRSVTVSNDERTNYLLRLCGLEARELRNLKLAPIHQLPTSLKGFGLVGPTGRGKTVALAQHLAARVHLVVANSSAPEIAILPFKFAKWVNWPGMADRLKELSAQGFWSDLQALMDGFSTCSSLYLDDLGQERIRGEEDLALGYLRGILDARYRAELAVFWASNLDGKALSATYGSRTVSRMLEAWPPVRIEGKDLRMEGFRGHA